MLPIGTHRAWVVVVLILLCSIHSLLAAPVQEDLGQSETALNKPNMTVKGVFESLLNFFRPMTCRLSNERPLIPCQVESLNASECLKNHCCPMKIGQDLQCHMPVKDDVQLAIRLILLTGGGFLILGFLPICFCAILQRSPCINPLQRMSKKVRQIARDRRERREQTNDEELHLLD
ncbi:fragile X mental retardation 1 neighbor protein [Empidonax traillii]|uniref:fragile X mental retardation 1 neighbor protein n=1 Tax=Empidonax traillii TaxID=164674 RepID=UPI000FFD6089|nr:fragile X mental retardation 1 neighbor protein [Empidonax traillii]XP_027737975.1 fragile X mental retardation 1 neighbor protein [Empidonax traillii]XP_027737976.1 fragile X mental retardation 1 neighbor protein [Empidonax traillii]